MTPEEKAAQEQMVLRIIEYVNDAVDHATTVPQVIILLREGERLMMEVDPQKAREWFHGVLE